MFDRGFLGLRPRKFLHATIHSKQITKRFTGFTIDCNCVIVNVLMYFLVVAGIVCCSNYSYMTNNSLHVF